MKRMHAVAAAVCAFTLALPGSGGGINQRARPMTPNALDTTTTPSSAPRVVGGRLVLSQHDRGLYVTVPLSTRIVVQLPPIAGEPQYPFNGDQSVIASAKATIQDAAGNTTAYFVATHRGQTNLASLGRPCAGRPRDEPCSVAAIATWVVVVTVS